MHETLPLSPEELTLLAGLEPLSGLPRPVLEALLEGAVVGRVAAGEPFAEAGRPQAESLLLLEGTVAEGDAVLPPGSLLGAASLLEERRWPATLTARTALRLVTLEPGAVRRACRDHGEALAEVAALRPAVLQQRDLSRVLHESAIFGDLDAPLLRDLESGMVLRVVKGGEQVLRAGEPSDSLLIVVGGRLRVSRRLPDGRSERLNEIAPGESVGEVGLALRQPRSADVVAVRDSTVALLYLEGFERLLKRHPVAFNRAIARIIFEYAKGGAPRRSRHTAQTFAVVPLHPGPAAGRLARRLCAALERLGEAHHLGVADGAALSAGEGSPALAIGRLSELERRFDYLVYEAEAEPTPWTRLAVRQADQVLFVAAAGEEPAPQPVERALAGERSFAMVRKSLVLLHGAEAAHAEGDAPWRAGREVERYYPLRDGVEGEVERLARLLTGRAVGVVLGGGGARGFAHLGVLRALEEAGIPVDMLGGNSMGALLGAQYACGTPLDLIREQTLRFIGGGERPTLPLVSLISGRRLERRLQKLFEGQAIETLWRPFFAVACNLSRAQLTVNERGPLWRAVLASNSPAGLLPPVLQGGELLVDGAILDNVPVGAMRARLGAGTLIAVDVDVREEPGVDPSLTRLSPWRVLRRRLTGGGVPQPGIVDILTRAGHIGGLVQRERSVAAADHYLQPPVAGFPLIGYRRAAEIAEVGYRYAAEQITAWDLRRER